MKEDIIQCSLAKCYTSLLVPLKFTEAFDVMFDSINNLVALTSGAGVAAAGSGGGRVRVKVRLRARERYTQIDIDTIYGTGDTTDTYCLQLTCLPTYLEVPIHLPTYLPTYLPTLYLVR